MAKTDKPLYVNPTGYMGAEDLPIAPPFVFNGVTNLLFPLQANMSVLTDFCDSYLNMDIPDEIVHFFPALPYVYLGILNYGSMSPLLFSAQNTGWISQEEVFFMVPLEVWRRENGKMVFKEWAFVSPFIFVNNSMSLTTGREVYGWAKVLGLPTADKPQWVENPVGPTRVFGLSAPVFPKEYAGSREENRMLLEINCEATTGFTLFPPRLGQAITTLPGVASGWLKLAGSVLDMATALPIRGYRTTRSLRTTLEIAGGAANQLLRTFGNPARRWLVDETAGSSLGYGREAKAFIDQITLKQFRNSEHPGHACYQALVRSRMGIDRINRAGFLGNAGSLLGDPTGGYSIRLHQYDAYPIVSSLGLEVNHVERNEAADVAVLKPMLPYWVDVDLYYDAGQTICSRHRGAPKETPASAWRPEAPLKAGDEPPKIPDQPPPRQGILFNTARGGSTQAIAGPFHFPDVTLQVYPLLASRDKLNEFVNNYLNSPLNPPGAPSQLRFEPFGDYVYLMLESIGSLEGVMWSESNNIGWWSNRSVSFCVPVKMFRDGELESIALLTPYRFANDNRAVISDREVNGRISVMAKIDSPPDVWLEESGPIKERRVLELKTLVLPAEDAGAEAVEQVLVRIDSEWPADVYNETRWRLIADRWSAPLVCDLLRKTAFAKENPEVVSACKTLALEILAMKAPVNWINLKQYRDAEHPQHACYQSLIKVSRTIENVFEIREIDEQRLYVKITDLPGFPIVQTLGLKVMHVVSKDTVEQVLQPIRPFWMRLGAKEELGQTLAWRVEKGEWKQTEALRAPEAWRLHVGLDLLAGLCEIRDKKLRAAKRRKEEEERRINQMLQEACKTESGQPIAHAAAKNTPANPAEPKLPGLRRLHQHATQWLFRALQEEVAEIRSILAALSDSDRQTLHDRLQRQSRTAPHSAALVVARDAVSISGKSDAADALKRLFRSISTNDLYAIVEILGSALASLGLTRKSDELLPQSKRFSVAEAKSWVAQLDDVQIVIESILSDEWENWIDDDDRPLASCWKPEFCIRGDSLYELRKLLLPPEMLSKSGKLLYTTGKKWFFFHIQEQPAPTGRSISELDMPPLVGASPTGIHTNGEPGGFPHSFEDFDEVDMLDILFGGGQKLPEPPTPQDRCRGEEACADNNAANPEMEQAAAPGAAPPPAAN